MLLLTFPKQGEQPLGPGRPGCVSVCAGEGRPWAHPPARGRKERGRYSWQGRAAGELRYAAHKGTLSGLRCQFLSPGPGRGVGGPARALPPGQGTLGKPLTHSAPHCPPWPVGPAPRSSECGPCAAAAASPERWGDTRALGPGVRTGVCVWSAQVMLMPDEIHRPRVYARAPPPAPRLHCSSKAILDLQRHREGLLQGCFALDVVTTGLAQGWGSGNKQKNTLSQFKLFLFSI